MGWSRQLYGRAYPGHPCPKRRFNSEVSGYAALAGALRDLAGWVPRHERGLFATLIECQAYCEERVKMLGGSVEGVEQKELFDGSGGRGD